MGCQRRNGETGPAAGVAILQRNQRVRMPFSGGPVLDGDWGPNVAPVQTLESQTGSRVPSSVSIAATH